MENPRAEKEDIIKDIQNFFRLKKELNHTAIKHIRKLCTLEKETKAIKDRILSIRRRFLSIKKKKIMKNQ